MNILKMFIYQIEDTATGIVMADNEEEAKHKVIEAYTKHFDGFDDTYDVFVYNAKEGWFTDSPDVLEVADL